MIKHRLDFDFQIRPLAKPGWLRLEADYCLPEDNDPIDASVVGLNKDEGMIAPIALAQKRHH